MPIEKIEIGFEKYYKYDELIGVVRTRVEAYPNLAELKCIGESYEGRKIWLISPIRQLVQRWRNQHSGWTETFTQEKSPQV